MIFKNIHLSYWFLSLVPLIAIMIVGYKTRLTRLKKTIDPSLWPLIVPGLSYNRRFWKRVLLTAAFICTLIALLRPQYGLIFKQVERSGQDIYIALDVSTSMLAEDIKPSRLVHAKREILGLIDELKGDRIGIIAFAGDAFVQCPLTFDYNALRLFLETLDPTSVGTPGTDIATAIKTARLSFKRVSQTNKPILVILSDGESFENDPVESAKVASKDNISIYTIGIGTPKGEPIPQFNATNTLTGYKKDKNNEVILSQLNEDILKAISQETDGKYFNSNLGSLVIDNVYKDISLNENRRLEEQLLKFHKDRYQWPLALAFILLLCDSLLIDRKRKQ